MKALCVWAVAIIATGVGCGATHEQPPIYRDSDGTDPSDEDMPFSDNDEDAFDEDLLFSDSDEDASDEDLSPSDNDEHDEDPPLWTLPAELCTSEGTLDFWVHAEDLAGLDGKTVIAVAWQNSNDFEGGSRQVVIFTTILNGSFSMLCSTSLTETFAYPSTAVLVDMDGDGRCSDADLGKSELLFGWNSTVDLDIDPGNPLSPQFGLSQPSSLTGPFGGPEGFCAGYFGEP